MIDWSKVTSFVATESGGVVNGVPEGEDGAVGQVYRATGPQVPALMKHKFRFLLHTQWTSVTIPDLSIAPPQAMNVYEVDLYVRTLLGQSGCPVGVILTPQGSQYPAVPNSIPNGCVNVNGKQVTVHTEMLVGSQWRCVYWQNNNWNDCLPMTPGEFDASFGGSIKLFHVCPTGLVWNDALKQCVPIPPPGGAYRLHGPAEEVSQPVQPTGVPEDGAVGQFYRAVQPVPTGYRIPEPFLLTGLWVFKIYRVEQVASSVKGSLQEIVWQLKLETQTGPLSMTDAQANQHAKNLGVTHCGKVIRFYDSTAGDEASAKGVIEPCFI